jgi:histidine triad (HIT) family protein
LPEETVFSKIVRREIPAEIVYQDELVTAFKDIHPRAPLHVLVIPNERIPTAADVNEAHEPMLGRLFRVATQIAAEAGVAHDGYRLIVNCRAHGGQEVDHLHMHVLGGRPLGRFLAD